jgi:nitroreductase
MEKPAPVAHPIHDLLRRRWSPRAFSAQPVPRDTLRSLFEAARWAASCFNDQPWAYLVATKDDPENFGKMLGVLVEGNAAWARHAPVLMLSLARLNFAHNGTPNRHAFHDVGAASASLTFEAVARGLAVHQMGGFFVDKAREAFNIPTDWEPVAAIALGYPVETLEAIPLELRERESAPRRRKSIEEFIMTGGFGRLSSLVQPSNEEQRAQG